MKDVYLSISILFLVPVVGTCLLFANLARTMPFPVSIAFPSLPQISAQAMGVDTATPESPVALKVVA